MPGKVEMSPEMTANVQKARFFLRTHVVAPFVVGSLLMIGIYKGIYQPQNATVAKLRQDNAQLEKKLKTIERINGAVESINGYSSLFPGQEEMGWWLNVLAELGKQYGISIKNISRKSREELGNYELVTVDVGVHCTYPQFIRFVRALGAGKRLIRVNSWELTRTDNGEVDGQLSLNTLAVK